jgi:hypothetical protein
MPLDGTGVVVERDFYANHYLFGGEPHATCAVAASGIMGGEGVAVR